MQTNRMVAAILVNAAIFHQRLARLHPDVAELRSFRLDEGSYHKGDILDAWRKILEINYWPIFHLASDLLEIIPEREIQTVVDRIERTAAKLHRYGAADIQDLSGRMFQQLITDRKFLATFYTLPPSAALLAELAIARLKTDWSDPTQIGSVRVADLACGTGALLGAAYHAIVTRFRRTGGDDRLLHQYMMEDVLTGADIMPAAVHLTAATLSGMHPDQPFGHTRIITMPYGEKSNGDGISIGSLDLIQSDQTKPVFGTGRTALSGKGEIRDDPASTKARGAPQDNLAHNILEVPDGTMDLVIMNPPFTRPTNHESTGVPIPSFAGFKTKEDEQSKMSVKLKSVKKALAQAAGHGNAGLASNFVDLAHAKIRPGGVLALVLPAVCAQGAAWKNARKLIETHYRDILVVSLAAAGDTDRAFSADTGMAEVLLIARRNDPDVTEAGKICMANLHTRPKTHLEAAVTTRSIEQCRQNKALNFGRLLHTKKQTAGSFFRSNSWNGIGIRDASLARFMRNLTQSRLVMPQTRESCEVPVCRMGDLGRRGYLDRDINGRTRDGRPRGPFDIEPIISFPEYPVLWAHDAARERQLVIAADRQAQIRPECDERAVQLWREGARRLHINRDFQLNSQSLAACMTERPSIGGRAWPNFICREPAWETPLVLWANTTLGLITYWWLGTRQQNGRAILTVTRLPRLLAINASRLSTAQILKCSDVFEDFREQTFLPANEAYRDDTRQALDHAMLLNILGLESRVLDGLNVLREQWCREPSVHGSKKTQPN